MSQRLESVLSTVLTLSAVVIATVLVRREFFPQQTVVAATPGAPPQFVPKWRAMLADGVRRGNTNAPVTIVEFMDLECPFCRALNERVKAAEQKFGDSLAVVVVHFPIQGHRFAKLAAQAAECADAQHAFFSFFDLALSKQDSLGLKSWGSYASEAGVPDTLAFHSCLGRSAPAPRIEQGLTLGKQFGVQATPTVLINGWRLSQPPDDAELSRIISSILAGKEPFQPSRT
jgi:protein-disulfide isomerase